ncbi:MAG: hypothetical protein M1832_000853 [Thelocarpon impressellum]|nr:MAG: hypothetical protein M1832_000853 [Thelocarpon impressellum]
MPFHHHQSPTTSSHQSASASSSYHAGQQGPAAGVPAVGNSRTAAGSEGLYLSGGDGAGLGGGAPRTASPTSAGPPGPGPGKGASLPSSQFETPRRQGTLGRQSEELHMPPQAGQQQTFQSTLNYGGSGGPPNIKLQQATPQGSSAAFSPSSPGGNLPGALQSGNTGRPLPSSVNTAPSSLPTVSQLSAQPYSSPSRSTSSNQSHSYSRSSPGGFDGQKYIPYSSTPESSKYATPPIQKYTPIQQQQGAQSNSPLGLADIRPRADSGMSDDPLGANPYSYDGAMSAPQHSNYQAPWAIYAFDWCKWSVTQPGSGGGAGKVAVGSYLEDGHNFIQILDTQIVPQPASEPTSSGATSYGVDYVKMAEATHSYPVTRILWEPPSSQKQSTDLLATSGDHLRLWSLPANATSLISSNSITRSSNSNRDPAPYKLTPLALLSNSKSPEHTAPLTSLDWNTLSPSLIITSSIDTTCTIWDIPTLTAKTQLIAHDKEVFDVRFCANSVDVFVSCGADGSVRMFDLRSLEHSTIIYEPTDKTDKLASPNRMSPTTAQQTMSYAPPLLRLSASPHDAHLLATFSQDSNIIRILDVRQPGQALLELRGHAASINCTEWSPSRRGMLASGADDSLVLVWDLINQNNTPTTPGGGLNGTQPGQAGASGDIGRGPTAAWRCDYEVGNISWAPQSGLTSHGGDWLGVSGGRGLWGVKL